MVSLIIVASRELQVVTQVDGIDFVLAKLRRGAVINHNNILFRGSTMKVAIRCSAMANLLLLTREDFMAVSSEEKELKQRYLQYKNKLDN